MDKKYAFLNAVGVLPRTITQALALYGTNEIPGQKSNAAILAWAKELNDAGFPVGDYGNDDIPWCGLFVAITAKRAGKTPQANPLWARNWANWAEPIMVNAGTNAKPRLITAGTMPSVGKAKPSLGDCLVFVRDGGGGHVGWYIAEDELCYHVLGGNQSNTVNVTRIGKSRCIAVRRPVMLVAPASLRPYTMQASGIISINEA